MGGEFNCDIAVAGQMQVRVMVFGLGDVADPAEKVEVGREVFDSPFAAEAFVVSTDAPLGNAGMEFFNLVGCQRRDAALAGLTFHLGEMGRGAHRGTLLSPSQLS